MADVTVVVPARNASSTIDRTLDALRSQKTEADYEVIVVDSGSSDDTPAVVEASDVARLLHNPGGEPAGSRNLGVAHATSELIAFTDADCVPAPDWIAGGLRALQAADIVQGRVEPLGPRGPFDRTVEVRSEYGLYETANLFVTREAFERVGGFQPVLAIGGTDTQPFGEDSWFVWRAKRAGASAVFADEALVRHAVFRRGWLEAVAEQYRCRHFPALVSLIPELRERFLHRRVFLSERSERFDLAVLGAAAAGYSRRWWPALIGGAPYVRHLGHQARYSAREERALVALTHLAGDAVAFVALLQGSLRARTPVL